MFHGMKLGLHIPSEERLAAVPIVTDYLESAPGLPLIADSVDYSRPLPRGLWGYLGNNVVGDCFWVAVANLLMAQQTNAGTPVHVYTTDDVLEWYKSTGFDPSDPSTDNGTDPISGMQWLQAQGIIEAFGRVPINGNDAHLAAAHELFGGVILGVQVPRDWMSSTTWGPSSSPIVGGHAIMGAGFDGACNIPALTWAKVVQLTTAGRSQNGMMALVAITKQWLQSTGQTLQGFDLAGLKAALAMVR